jgi:aspartyl-tRNA synthetase
MHAYRTHSCGQLRETDVGARVRLSGWVHRKRDHGGVLFVDLRDHYGLTQIVARANSEPLGVLEHLRAESVVTIEGEVVSRGPEATNPNLATGAIEVVADSVTVQSSAEELPLPVAGEADYPEEIRLRYRYLDLRRERLHANILLRSQVIASIRRRMIDQGFTEFQTPILTASSPEGARDYLVPEPRPPRQVLRAPAGAADVQAADHGRRLRPLFPDRALLPRRGRPRRPLARRILPARFRDELRHPGRCFRGDRAGAAGVFEEFADGKKVTPAGPSRASPIARRS